MVKVSQESYLNNPNNYIESSPSVVIYSYKNNFERQKLSKIISQNKQNKVATFLYIKEIDRSTLHTVSVCDFSAVIIAKEISEKIHHNETLLNCISLISLCEKKKHWNNLWKCSWEIKQSSNKHGKNEFCNR